MARAPRTPCITPCKAKASTKTTEEALAGDMPAEAECLKLGREQINWYTYNANIRWEVET